MLCATIALLLAAAAAAPAPATAPASPSRRLDLTEVIEHARRQPSVEIARAAAREAHAKAVEVSRMWLPQIEITVIGGPSQRITCMDVNGQPTKSGVCITTEPSEAQLGFEGAFFRIDGNLKMPLFTFGKLSNGSAAADAGARAGDALAEAAAHDAGLDAARAYFAIKLGRELQVMLGEGTDYLNDELKREEALIKEGSGEVSEADRRRVLTLKAELDARLSEAKKVEELGLAGVHYTTGEADVDVDEKPLFPVDFDLPSKEVVRALSATRPEQRAAMAGEEAAARLVDLEWAKWWPDFVLVGGGAFARSTSVDHPKNAFLTDPYNANWGALGIALRWAPDLFTRGPQIDQAEARQAKARATLEMARSGLPAEAEKLWSEARDARDRMKAAKDGVKHSRAWLASVLQSEAAGLAETRDLADALLQYFMQRARLIQATFEWNVGVVAIYKATGRLPGVLRYVEEE